MRLPLRHFLQRITALHGVLVAAATPQRLAQASLHRNTSLAGSAIALHLPLALRRAALAAVLTGMFFTGYGAFPINTFVKAST